MILNSLIIFAKKYGFSGLTTYFKLKIGITSQISLKGVNGTFFLRGKSSDIAVFKQIFIHGDYEIDLDFEPKSIIDAGANIGIASIFFANKYPKALIFAIELSPSNYRILHANTSSIENIKAINAGIWNKKERIFINERAFSYWGFQLEVKKSSNQSIEVDAITIDELMASNQLTKVDLLKIDIEGAEDNLFSSNVESWLPNIRVIIIEFHDRHFPGSSDRIKTVLAEYKFIESSRVGENHVFTNQNFLSKQSSTSVVA